MKIIDCRPDKYAALTDALFKSGMSLEPIECPDYEIKQLQDTRTHFSHQLWPNGPHWPARWEVNCIKTFW